MSANTLNSINIDDRQVLKTNEEGYFLRTHIHKDIYHSLRFITGATKLHLAINQHATYELYLNVIILEQGFFGVYNSPSF